jgi:hypothetical protein
MLPAPVPDAHLERDFINELKGPYEMQANDSRYDLHVHNVRKRLADTDGISIKAALDAIVRDERTVFIDDSAKEIRQVTYSQEQGPQEMTIFTFKQCQDD